MKEYWAVIRLAEELFGIYAKGNAYDQMRHELITKIHALGKRVASHYSGHRTSNILHFHYKVEEMYGTRDIKAWHYATRELLKEMDELEVKVNKPKASELDQLDNKIIEIYQAAEKKTAETGLYCKPPSANKIARAAYDTRVTPKLFTKTAINKRIGKLRRAGLLESSANNNEEIQDPNQIEDYSESHKLRF